MTMTILIVTVLVAGQPATSYQTQHVSKQSCEQAREQVLKKYARQQPQARVTAMCKEG